MIDGRLIDLGLGENLDLSVENGRRQVGEIDRLNA